MAISVFAPAKINLTLHVTGQGRDGFHLLDSLVVFAPVGDVLSISPADYLDLRIDGPEAAGLTQNDDNIVKRAAQLLRPADGMGAAIELTKNLPVSSGIGGGSADAAAALRGLSTLWSQQLTDEVVVDLPRLGADVSMCMASAPCRVRGIGEQVERLAKLPPIPAVLVNPRVPVSTPAVFRALEQKINPPMPDALPQFSDLAGLVDWLSGQRNDLQAVATAMAPPIAEAIVLLGRRRENMLARMSGSGATCFGIFPNLLAARKAAKQIRAEQPDWWVAHGVLGDQSRAARPSVS